MRYLLVLLVVAGVARADNVDYHARFADLFLERVVPKENWHDVRFVSMVGTPKKDRATRLKTMQFWLNNLHFGEDVELIQEVPKSDGLYWFYLKDFGWNATAWKTVALREPYCIEPAIYPDVAMSLRKKIGLTQDKKTFHIEAMVRADWLFRDSVETDRSPTYYDLLFAKQRFTDKIYHPGGDYRWYDGTVSRNVEAGWYDVPGFINFPKDETEWSKVFGADIIEKFLKDKKINAKHGAIVEEGASIVARHNRLLERIRVPYGYYWKTFDVNETSDKRDFAEQLIYDFEFDAGELIANLPNGGQAYLLTDAKGKIVEVADSKVAIDGSDRRDVRVRTPGSCVICHQSGIIDPPNLVTDLLKAGIDIKFKDKKKRREVHAFFFDWEHELKYDQSRYERFIKRTSGFTSAINATKFKEWRDWYDQPITAKQAAEEMGAPLLVAKLIWSKSPRVRLNLLVQGKTIPRSTWEKREYRESMLLWSLSRPPPVVEVHIPWAE